MEINYLKSDWHKTLMVKGEHSKEEIIAQAYLDQEWDETEIDKFLNSGEFKVGYWKAIPRRGYDVWYEESNESVRGAFKASIISLIW